MKTANGQTLLEGDVVGLISGGPPMAVEAVLPEKNGRVIISVVWSDTVGAIHYNAFSMGLLVKLCPGCLNEHDEDEEHGPDQGSGGGTPPKDNRAS